ncbi:MAG: GntR family transcriptional regulator [Dehalococcoidia bacterium]|nr:GntR family transcriptional regulator [Dehalococcoidia bacterium]
MAIRKTPARTKADVVHEALQNAILSGNIAPGEHLRQEEVAAKWGVSQTPVREAFRRLESEGLVEHAANRGVVVRGIPWTPPPPPMEAIARRWEELVRDPDSVPGSDFP